MSWSTHRVGPVRWPGRWPSGVVWLTSCSVIATTWPTPSATPTTSAHACWIHSDDRDAAPYATDLIEGTEPSTVGDDVTAFPVPGHTRGSVLYLVDGHLLFSGDSLSWNPNREQLHAFRRACWFSWPEQTASLSRFADHECGFDRLFCGHGWNHDAPAAAMADHLVDLVARMPEMG